jgi:hypothetical protein
VEKQRRWAVRDAFRVQPAQHAQAVDVSSYFGKEIRNPAAALAMLREFPGRIHHALRRFPFTAVGPQTGIVERHFLAIVPSQARLVVKRIDLTNASLHEQEDYALGASGVMRKCWLSRHVGQRSVSSKGRPRQCSESAARGTEKLSTRSGVKNFHGVNQSQ